MVKSYIIKKVTAKRGRKCSIRTCRSFQQIHKNLSFFRFPRNEAQCKVWIENADRIDLSSRPNVHDARICQLHFEKHMFKNPLLNRLHKFAIPTLRLPSQKMPNEAAHTNYTSDNVSQVEFLSCFALTALDKAEKLPLRKTSVVSMGKDKSEKAPMRKTSVVSIGKVKSEKTPLRKTSVVSMGKIYVHRPIPLTMPITVAQQDGRKRLQETSLNICNASRQTIDLYNNSIQQVDLRHTPMQSLDLYQNPMKPIDLCLNPTKSIEFYYQNSTKSDEFYKNSLKSVEFYQKSTKTIDQKPTKPIDLRKPSTKWINLYKSSLISNNLPNTPTELNNAPIFSAKQEIDFDHSHQIFTDGQEHQLADFVRETATYYSGLSSREIRVMAYVYGLCNAVKMPAAWLPNHVATLDWCVAFVKRNNIPDWMVTDLTPENKTPYYAETYHDNSNIITIELE